MLGLRPTRASRRGAVLPLTAILIVFLLALTAFAIDLGWIMVVRTQLQSAADSAALAGTQQLLDSSYLAGTTAANTGAATDSAMAKANTSARAFAGLNSGGNVTLDVALNEDGGGTPVNDPAGDIVCGYLAAPSDQSASLVVSTPGVGPYPNSVQVTIHRDNIRNGSLCLFFAPVLGITGWDLQAKATATYEGGISGFQIRPNGPATCKLLPFALRCQAWSNAPTDPWYDASQPPGLLQSTGTDAWTRAADGSVTAGADGINEATLLPLSDNNATALPNNFGTLNIGTSTDLGRLVQYGPNAGDLSSYPGGKLQLDSQSHTLVLPGNPGISASCVGAASSIVGQPRVLALYSTASGTGDNCRYTIVGFAGATLVESRLNGSLPAQHLTIQPCWCIDPNALGGGNPGTSWYVVKPLALSR
jgi:Flp pilus assembly protein TadG